MRVTFQENSKMKRRKYAFLGKFFTFYLSYLFPLLTLRQKFYRQIPNLIVLAGSFSLFAVSRLVPVPHMQVGVVPALAASPFLVVFDHHLNRKSAANKVIETIEKRFKRLPISTAPVRTYNEGPPPRIAPNQKIKARARSDPVPI